MSVVVHAQNAAARRLARQRLSLKRHIVVVSGTLMLMLASAALPLPVWQARAGYDRRAAEFQTQIDGAVREEHELEKWRGRHGDSTSGSLVSRWFDPVDRLHTRNLLLACARGCGLSVRKMTVVRVGSVVGERASARAPKTVLGVPVDTASGVPGRVLPLHVERFTIQGSGPLASILALSGVLRELAVPLSLHDVTFGREADEYVFELSADRLIVRNDALVEGTSHGR